jgi:hypothetical protein
MSIRCGSCKGRHETVAEVRNCAGSPAPTLALPALNDAEFERVAAGIREMEEDGILPRSRRPYTAEDAKRDLVKATAPQSIMRELLGGKPAQPAARAVRLSPNGLAMPEEYQGSPKQFDYLHSLLEELGRLEGYKWEMMTSVRKASMEIETLKDRVRDNRRLALAEGRAPAKAVKQTVTGQVSQDGIYRNPETGELFKVQVAHHGSGHLYAKQAFLSTLEGDLAEIPLDGDRRLTDRIGWDYKPGLLNKIKPEWRVTREEAVAFGALYGECIRCGRTLTNEDSIEAAIGPVCRGKMGF